MTIPLQRRVLAAVVFFISLVVFGPLTYLVSVRTAEILTGFGGIDPPLTGTLSLLVTIGAVVIALNAVWEIAAVHIHGFAILDRGSSTWRLVRHLLLAVAVLATVIVVTELAVGMIQWGLTRDRVFFVVGPLMLVAALVWAATRAIGAFREGFYTATASPSDPSRSGDQRRRR